MRRKLCIIGLMLALAGCGPETTSEKHDADGILIATRDENGGIHWACLAATGGGNEATSAYLISWEPDTQGHCWKAKK